MRTVKIVVFNVYATPSSMWLFRSSEQLVPQGPFSFSGWAQTQQHTSGRGLQETVVMFPVMYLPGLRWQLLDCELLEKSTAQASTWHKSQHLEDIQNVGWMSFNMY